MKSSVTYHVAKTFNAPIKYVYEWCTDFREDDNKLFGGKYSRTMLEKTRKRVIYASEKTGQDGKPKLAVRMVTLSPSRHSWHLDFFSEENVEVGEYKLSSFGKNNTKLHMVFKSNWKEGRGPSREELEKETQNMWDKFATALENDYASRKAATA